MEGKQAVTAAALGASVEVAQGEPEPEQEHKFWDTQPVPRLGPPPFPAGCSRARTLALPRSV